MPPWLTTKETLLQPPDDGGDEDDDDFDDDEDVDSYDENYDTLVNRNQLMITLILMTSSEPQKIDSG